MSCGASKRFTGVTRFNNDVDHIFRGGGGWLSGQEGIVLGYGEVIQVVWVWDRVGTVYILLKSCTALRTLWCCVRSLIGAIHQLRISSPVRL